MKPAYIKFKIDNEDIVKLNKLDLNTKKESEIRATQYSIANPNFSNDLPKNYYIDYPILEDRKNKILENYKDVSQIWFELEKPKDKHIIEDIIKKHFKKYYPECKFDLEIQWALTKFTKRCYIKEHKDGRDSNRLAGMLIYLNKNYNKENGGILNIIEPMTGIKTEILPEFGEAIILDYIDNEISHEVTKVTAGERLAICAFIHKNTSMGKSEKILVTGASGFIGSQLVKTLQEKGYHNIRTTSFSRDLPNSIPIKETIEHFKGDLRDAEFCEKVTKDASVVFHLAANTSNALDTKYNPLLHVTPNIEMNVNLMEQSWRNGVKRFIFISSNTVYPDMKKGWCTEDINVHATPLVPIYKAVGGMKRYGEMLCDFFSNQIHNPMQCVIIRPSNAFGPNDKFDYEKCHVTPANIRKVADGLNPIPVWGDGNEVRDLLHVEDMAEGILWVAEMAKGYGIYNVCYGEGFSIKEVLGWLKEIEQNENPIEYVNNKAPMIPIRLLSSKKVNDMGWKPKRDLKQALKETLEWYKQNKNLYNPNSKP
jgi:GDP-L-fucose synthase